MQLEVALKQKGVQLDNLDSALNAARKVCAAVLQVPVRQLMLHHVATRKSKHVVAGYHHISCDMAACIPAYKCFGHGMLMVKAANEHRGVGMSAGVRRP